MVLILTIHTPVTSETTDHNVKLQIYNINAHNFQTQQKQTDTKT